MTIVPRAGFHRRHESPGFVTTLWPLAVHALMLRDLPPRAAMELASARGYQGLFWQLESDEVELALAAVRDSSAGQRSPLAVTAVGVGPDDRNSVEPERAAEIA